MVSALRHKKCFNHQKREAVAVCPSCTRVYCRECILEHKKKMICSNCLEKSLEKKESKALPFIKKLGHTVVALTMFVVLWFIFYFIGQLLLMVPVEYLDGSHLN